jgi:methyl-accepting chemotaxis protein
VAAAAEEQLAMISEVNAQASVLSEQARHLMEQADKFKV